MYNFHHTQLVEFSGWCGEAAIKTVTHNNAIAQTEPANLKNNRCHAKSLAIQKNSGIEINELRGCIILIRKESYHHLSSRDVD